MDYKNYTLKEFYQMAMSEVNYSVRRETARDRVRRVEKHIIPYLGNVRLIDLTALRLERWQIDLLRLRGIDQVRRCKNLLKNILNRAIVHGIIDNNPIEATAQLREPKSDGREIYTREELEQILYNSTGQLHLFILTMVSLGVRSGEIIVLRFSDIDWGARTIKVQRAMRKGEIKATKTGTWRTIDIPIGLFNKLLEHRASHSEDYIFINQNGTPYRDTTYFLRRHFKPFLERIGVKYKSLYSLRHTYATMSLQGGQSINYVAKQLGHRDTRTTQEYYIKYLRNNEDLERADRILSF